MNIVNKNKAAQALAKLRHEKHPFPPEHYKKMSEAGRAGREKYWAEYRKKKELTDSIA